MANTENDLSHLKPGTQTFLEFDKVFNLQKTIQEDTYGYKFKDMSLAEIAKFWFMNKHAMEDELSEMFDALGGIRDGIGNAVWKPWKKDNALGNRLSIEELSSHDRHELLMEYVDIFHFFINFGVSVGFTGSEVVNAYISKNKENIRRQENNY